MGDVIKCKNCSEDIHLRRGICYHNNGFRKCSEKGTGRKLETVAEPTNQIDNIKFLIMLGAFVLIWATLFFTSLNIEQSSVNQSYNSFLNNDMQKKVYTPTDFNRLNPYVYNSLSSNHDYYVLPKR